MNHPCHYDGQFVQGNWLWEKGFRNDCSTNGPGFPDQKEHREAKRTQEEHRPLKAYLSSQFSSILGAWMSKKVLHFPVGESLGEDQDVLFRLMEMGDVAYSPRALTEYS